MKDQLSLRQNDVLFFMRQFFLENDQLPPVQSIADFLGCKPNNAFQIQQILERKGHIEKNIVGKYRFAR